MLKNMLIGQSGGPTAAINASLAGAIKEAMTSTQIGEIYGACNGLEGALKGNIINLRKMLNSEFDFQLLKATPAMALGSCRFKLHDKPDDTYRQALDMFKKYNIGYFFYIGGNDSMDVVNKFNSYFSSLAEDIKVIGIPKTIDNDLACTDHAPGFASAAKFVSTSMAEISFDSFVYDVPSVTIVEIMGRDAGWLTASSALARNNSCAAPHLIYMPETAFDTEAFLSKVKELIKTDKNVVVAVSEGIHSADGSYIAESLQSGVADAFGHKYLSGVGKCLENLVREKLGCKVRSIELNVLQRVASHLCSEVDIIEAENTGRCAVQFALEGKTGVMAAIKRISNNPYIVTYLSVPVSQVANKVSSIPVEWISPDGCDVTEELIEYLKPLVFGEAKCFFSNGVPQYFSFDKTYVKI
jgi:6-phosphofructokinase 1